jgi:hypothetical protein
VNPQITESDQIATLDPNPYFSPPPFQITHRSNTKVDKLGAFMEI